MKTLSQDEFLINLRDSGLVSQEEIDAGLRDLPGRPSLDGNAVAERLVATGRLTPFQAASVRERHFRELVVGNYQILDRLGSGGMGTVYKARHRRMKRVVAIKVLTRTTGQPATHLLRFQREVEALARLSHPNIVMAHDADEAELGHFLVMEFINGCDLATAVQKSGPLPVREAIECIVQAARGMAYAHAQGINHRDIKPANLLRDAGGVVKVADLGLARFNDTVGRTSEEPSTLTQAGSIMGTVDYMAPEQALGLPDVDHRADIYSLGCTLHFLLTGRPPYQAATLMATLVQHREAAIPSLCSARNDVPAALDRVFQRMVAKASKDRFSSMGEVVDALESLLLSQEARPALAPTVVDLGATLDFAPATRDGRPAEAQSHEGAALDRPVDRLVPLVYDELSPGETRCR